MMKMKAYAMIGVILLLLPLASSLIQPAKASSDHWDEYWHAGIYENYPGYPEDVSTTITVYNDDESQWVKIALVVSVYQYEPYVDDDIVVLRVALYYDSFADGVLPVPAYAVTLCVQKDTEGSNFYDQAMEVRYSAARPGFAQGSGLDQSSYLGSNQDDREWWALHVLSFAAGLFYEPIDVVTDLISLGNAWAPQAGPDYDDADWSDYGLYSWWDNPGYDFGYDNPVRQYAFNTIEWIQHNVNPSTYYGIKVWARVVLTQPTLLPPFIDTAPVYLQVHHKSDGGGGGPICPTLFVWDGSDYTDLGVIDIHADGDVVREVSVPCESVGVNEHKAQFRLREGWEGLTYSHSEIDQVKLHAVDSDGNWRLCPLVEATHSELGNVLPRLLLSDDRKCDMYLLETIDLTFVVPSQTDEFVFVIEGCNMLKF